MSSEPARVGIIGAGHISARYIENAQKFKSFDILAVADVRVDGAKARASEFNVPIGCSVEDLLANPEIDLVINLTPHRVHGAVGLQVLNAGKHVYNEKPLAVYRNDALAMVETAAANDLRVGGAPDTFFGGAWQTARAAIDGGLIGEPVGAFANLHSRRDSNPNRRPGGQAANASYTSFYATDFFEFGGGAVFDRGPYYLNALIHLLGPFTRVSAMNRVTWPTRSHADRELEVHVPTHVNAQLEFANGAICSFTMTDDVYSTDLPHIEIYGSEGSLRCIDPNEFAGDILLRRRGSKELELLPNRFGYNGNCRGVGVADMVTAIANDRPHRAHGDLACHVVDVINSVIDASDQRRHIDLVTTCAQPAPLPMGLADWTIDR